MIFNIFVNDKYTDFIKLFLDGFEGKKLIISLIQEDRKLEDRLGIIDEVIYDNSDFLSGLIELEDAIIEVSDSIDILPSSYKKKISKLDYIKLQNDINALNYDYVFVLFNNSLDISNINNIIKIIDKNELLNNEFKYIITSFKNRYNYVNNLYGYLNENEIDKKLLIDNMLNDNYIELKNKTIIEKIVGIFNKNE